MVTVMKSSQEQVSLRFSFKSGGGSQFSETACFRYPRGLPVRFFIPRGC
jgi:hypothetical protein